MRNLVRAEDLMARYEVPIDESLARTLSAIAAKEKKNVPQVIAEIVTAWFDEHQESGDDEQFRRLVEESITENEPVLRRFASI